MTNVEIKISPKVIKDAIALLKAHSKTIPVDEISLSLELYQFVCEISEINRQNLNNVTSYLLAAAKLFDEDFHISIALWDRDRWANIIDYYFPPEDENRNEIHAHEDTIEKI